ncbi:hypothetical protein [Glaciibacter psychrotolerans]|uniref:Uncharacterized protein n=1 Tax=Glaciibacter psychrotolerans TaxID=670054 RepID=A0A7Z0J5S3_9MICO|nr:hypothetical protein [Leifsonia psychrotolerans]NYJ19133.1 hypothetical protein [Leifsonia psychrotolerans]
MKDNPQLRFIMVIMAVLVALVAVVILVQLTLPPEDGVPVRPTSVSTVNPG